MGTNSLMSRANFWLLMPMFALAIGGCILPDNAPLPSPTPRPAITVIPSSTPTPRPTPVPSETPVPSPSPTEPVQVQCSIEWRWVENELVIIKVILNRADGLAPGDKVIAINGRISLEVILEAEKEIGGNLSPEELRQAAVRHILTRDKGRALVLVVQHNGEPPYFFNLLPGCH